MEMLDITTFLLDTKAPAALDTVTQDRIIYKRVPWGSDATGGAKTFTLRGGANTLSADSTNVFVYDNDTASPGSMVGSVIKRPDNGFDEFTLNGADRANIYIGATDAAGNLSALSAVKDIEWTATMGYKVAGSTIENPHIYEARSWFTHRYIQSDAEEPNVISQLGKRGGTQVETSGSGDWIFRGLDPGSPSARSGHALAFDSIRGKVVLFGGRDAPMENGETWEWDGSS